MNSRFNSEIAIFFDLNFSKDKKRRESGLCKRCKLAVKGHSTSNYWKHLQLKHQKCWKEYNKNNDNSNNNNDNNTEILFPVEDNETIIGHKRARSESTQITMQDYNYPVLDKSKLTKFRELVAETFAKLGFSHSLIENEGFRRLFREYKMLEAQDNQVFSSRKLHKKLILEAGDKEFKKVLKSFKENRNFVTLAVDGWTGHTYGAKNTNIVALSGEKSYLLWSDSNQMDTDNAENYLFPLIHNKILELIKEDIAVCAVTTDNAANMVSTGRLLYDSLDLRYNRDPSNSPVVLHILCSAHTIELILKDILELTPIKGLFQSALAIIDPFLTKGGKLLRISLKNTQEKAEKKPLKLVIYNQTRWLSRFNTIKRLIELKTDIQWVYHTHSVPNSARIQDNSYWTQLESILLPLFKAFATAINMVQSDSATLLTLDKALAGIRTAIDETDFKNSSNSSENLFHLAANDIINRRINSSVLANGNHYAYWAVSLLTGKKLADWQSSFGNITKDYDQTVDWLANWGADLALFYPNHFQINCPREKEAIHDRIRLQIVQFQAGLGPFSNKMEKLKSLSTAISENSFDFDPNNPGKTEFNWIYYWNDMKETASELSNLAVCLLSIGITEASCERTFSIQKIVHSVLRNRLTPEIVEAEMRIRVNNPKSHKIEEEDEASDED
jgi:hypothetical protein